MPEHATSTPGFGGGFTFVDDERRATPVFLGSQHEGRREVPPRAEKILRGVIIALLALIPLFQLTLLVPYEWTNAATVEDATAYWAAAERVRAGQSLYQPVAPGPHVPGAGAPYIYPPFFAAFLVPLDLPHASFARFFLLLSVLCYWFYAACLGKLSTGRFGAMATLGWGAALMATFGAQGAIAAGQVEPLIWALFGAALVFPAARAATLTAAGAIKVYAVWPFLLAAWVDRKAVLKGAGITALVIVAFSALMLGPVTLYDAFITWFRDILPTLTQGQFAYGLSDAPPQTFMQHLAAYFGNGNLSLGFLPLQLAHLAGWNPEAGPIGALAGAYLKIIGVAAPLATFYFLRRRTMALRLAAAMCAAMLFGPIFRSTYTPILFALLAAWIADRKVTEEHARGDHYRVAMR